MPEAICASSPAREWSAELTRSIDELGGAIVLAGEGLPRTPGLARVERAFRRLRIMAELSWIEGGRP